MQISFMQNPIVLIFLRRGGRQLNLVWRGMNWVLLCLISFIHKTRLYIYIYILCNILEGLNAWMNYAVNSRKICRNCMHVSPHNSFPQSLSLKKSHPKFFDCFLTQLIN
jgi:hypothetical protein